MLFPLHPETPAEGQSLDVLFGKRGLDAEAIYLNMKSLMEAEGLPYGRRTHTYNSRLAQELAKWAETQDNGDAIHMALYEAYFVDNRNIGDPAVLLEIVAETGLDVDVAAVVLGERTFSDAVDEDWSLARSYGVTGVPTFVADGRGVVGCQDYEVLSRLVEVAGGRVRAGSG